MKISTWQPVLSGIVAVTTLLLFACNKTEDLGVEPLSDYVPLAEGKYITYAYDSVVYTNFGRDIETHSYQLKHVVDKEITDAQGRPAWRVIVYINDKDAAGPWLQVKAYSITLLDKKMETLDENIRYIRLQAPLAKDFSWKGNSYVPDEPYKLQYNFYNDNFMRDWEYHYTSVNDTFYYGQELLSKVVSVEHVWDDTSIDTVEVSNNSVTLEKNTPSAWIRGTATDNVLINAPAPTQADADTITLYNRTSFPAVLDGIIVPAGVARSFEYSGNQWTYKNGKDTLFSSLPFGSKTISTEQYAPQIGLVSKHLEMWEFQPDAIPEPYYIGFTIKMRMIDHN